MAAVLASSTSSGSPSAGTGNASKISSMIDANALISRVDISSAASPSQASTLGHPRSAGLKPIPAHLMMFRSLNTYSSS